MDTHILDCQDNYKILFQKHLTPMWVFDKKTMMFLAVNEMAVKHYGYSEEEFLSMTVKQIRPSEELPRFMYYVNTMLESSNGHSGYAGVWRHLKKDGTVIEVEINWSPIQFSGRDAFLVMANDITKRKAIEEALLETNQTMQALIQASPLAIIWLDGEGKVKLWNPSAQKMFGWTKDEVLGRVLPIVPEEKKEEFFQLLQEELNGNPHSSLELKRKCKNGTSISVKLWTAPLQDIQGKIWGVMGIMAPITDH